MQLVAYGAQDIYLTGNPQITFFKVVYRRHTNFSMEAIKQTMNGSASGSDGSNSTVTISRNGDLVYKIYVCDPKQSPAKTGEGGSDLVKEVELEIGGQRIDRHYSEWMKIWTELSTPESKAVGLKAMQGDIGVLMGKDASDTGVSYLQIPLQFWFCRNPGLALPLIALQYHEVKLKFTWGGSSTSGPEVWCDYIYLDTDERRRFAQVSHEYLIEQLQRETMTSGAGDKRLNFNHPVKELIWTTASDSAAGSPTFQLKLNGHDRFAQQHQEYFTLRQPFDYHTAVPRTNLPSAAKTSTSTFSSANDLTRLGTEELQGGTGAANAAKTLQVVGAKVTSAALQTAGFGSVKAGDTIMLVVSNKTGVKSGTADAAVGDVFVGTVTSVEGDVLNFSSPGLVDSTGTKALGVASDKTTARFLGYRVNNAVVNEARTSNLKGKINVYSFALKPEEHQPSGTCNFSRIDNAQLNVGKDLGIGTIYAVNYNVLRIMSGMGGLAYSN